MTSTLDFFLAEKPSWDDQVSVEGGAGAEALLAKLQEAGVGAKAE